MIVDLHVHTRRSLDACIRPEKVVQIARRAGLSGIAITDHDTLQGAIDVQAANSDDGFLVILGAEYRTDCGDIVALFIEHEIDERESEQVIANIHEQGGLALLPHPYHSHTDVERLAERCDLIEIWNARIPSEMNQQAAELATNLAKPGYVGSDAHFAFEIGACRVITESDNVRNDLARGRFRAETGVTQPWVPMASSAVKAWRLSRYIDSAVFAASALKKAVFNRR